ncbi:MAG: PmoA family protein [Thermoguttaceae bacterium]
MKIKFEYRCLLSFGIFLLTCFAVTTGELFAKTWSLRETEKQIDVIFDNKLFASYLTNMEGSPIIWPIIGPTGKKMTRDFPMIEREDKSEAKDHPHHRSLWFTHGEVNESNFWNTGKDNVQHRTFLKKEANDDFAVIETANDWITESGKVLCRDVSSFRFHVLTGPDGKKIHAIDCEFTVTAAQEEVIFGDTKEGTFAIRVPGTMDVDAKKRNPNWGGEIVNAEGLRNDDAWAKRSNWVDYSGPVDDETLGIAILNHPSSFRFPTYWHVRTYGLFAANPFGVHDFEKKKEKVGELRMKNGDSFTLKYRVLFHEGNAENSDIEKQFQKYAAE